MNLIMNNIITILLTSTINIQSHKCYLYQTNKEERRNTYLKSILKWLNETDFNIVLVENSGYKFDELKYLLEKHKSRFEIITFCEANMENAKFLENNNSKGSSEIYSINYAYDNSDLLKKATFIIKVTGRYFIPDFQNYLSNFDMNNYDVLTQNDVNKCEIVGCHINHFSDIFNNNLLNEDGIYTGHVEYVYKYRCSLYNNVLHLKVFQIEPTQRGGTPEIYNTI